MKTELRNECQCVRASMSSCRDLLEREGACPGLWLVMDYFFHCYIGTYLFTSTPSSISASSTFTPVKQFIYCICCWFSLVSWCHRSSVCWECTELCLNGVTPTQQTAAAHCSLFTHVILQSSGNRRAAGIHTYAPRFDTLNLSEPSSPLRMQFMLCPVVFLVAFLIHWWTNKQKQEGRYCADSRS